MRRGVATCAFVVSLGVLSSAACSPGADSGTPGGEYVSASQAPPPETSEAAMLQFPGKNVDVFLTGWDSANQMVLFRLARQARPENGAPYWSSDPSDSSEHRLPLAADANILSAWTGCF